MDESADKDRSNALPFSGSNRPGEEEGLGATGVFRAVDATEEALGDAERSKPAVPGIQESIPRRSNVPDIDRLAEPVVHRVVFDSAPPASSQGMPARVFKTASSPVDNATTQTALESASQSNSPLSDSGSGGAGEAGFTQILQSMGVDSMPNKPATTRISGQSKEHAPASDGFTALLRSLSNPGPEDRTVESRLGTNLSPVSPSPVPPNAASSAKGPAASGTGEFTALLRATQDEAGDLQGAKASGVDPRSQTPAQSSAPSPSRAGNEPGEFTRLLGSFAEDQPGAKSRPTDRTVRPQTDPVNASSFSKLLSVDQLPTANRSDYPVGRAQEFPDFRFSDAPPVTRGPASSHEAFSFLPGEKSPLPPNSSAEGDVGITRLIQMLDSPSLPSDRAKQTSTADPASRPGGTDWTSTFGKPSESDAVRPPASQASQSVGAFGPAGGPQPGRSATQGPTTEAASGAASGPSEYTRIIDASRMRESSRAAAQKAEAAPAAPQAPAATPSPGAQMPGYPVQLPYPMQSMPGVGGMPQVGGFPQAQSPHIPGYSVNVGPGGGSFSGGSLPQMPGVYLPSAPQPPVLQTPAMGTGSAGVGKLQKYIPLLLIVIIFLLLGLIVTVVFLLKH